MRYAYDFDKHFPGAHWSENPFDKFNELLQKGFPIARCSTHLFAFTSHIHSFRVFHLVDRVLRVRKLVNKPSFQIGILENQVRRPLLETNHIFDRARDGTN